MVWLSCPTITTPPRTTTATLGGVVIVGLGGLAVAGGIVYLAEKLIQLGIGAAKVLADLIIEKFHKMRWEAGHKQGREATHKQWMAWYERQQAAHQVGQSFDEPPPGLQNNARSSYY